VSSGRELAPLVQPARPATATARPTMSTPAAGIIGRMRIIGRPSFAWPVEVGCTGVGARLIEEDVLPGRSLQTTCLTPPRILRT
jgi:hypothetical protein